MASHAYIQTEDLGLTVYGVAQCSYTVGGEHSQDYDTAVYRAALSRCTAMEVAVDSYSNLINLRQRKIEDLGECIAQINSSISGVEKPETDTMIGIDGNAVNLLRRYGYDASSSMRYDALMKLVQNVEYDMDQEDNYMQQDLNQIQNYLNKRDDSMQMANRFMKKIANTRSTGIKNIGS